MSIGLAGSAAAQTAGPPSGDNVQPTFVDGNPTCAALLPPDSFLFEYKQEEPVEDATNIPLSFTNADTGQTLMGTLDIDVSNSSQGQVFSFDFDGDFVAIGVFAKGGSGGNLYDYRPTGNADDSLLHAPVNTRNNRFFDLSHISFCIGQVQPGALRIVKNSSKGGLVQTPGAEFSVTGSGYSEKVTDSTTTPNGQVPDEDPETGEICISGLTPGQYTVAETKAPQGYAGDQDTKTATVVSGTNCTDNQPTGQSNGQVTFSDPPLTDLTVHVKGQLNDETKSRITCDGESSGELADPADLSVPGLEPGTYTCTIFIDP
ncbi:hypothetical protein ADL12_17855 [Streptomyces regalis]|uniref:SpaA-like prealbumin fold domain-containing protein n=1 Tax=Streptomyces regalis TaxID=68262 RepID=A0A0X3UZN2_9ACTN|nr:hypothetical protein ADL12_17855 [Streptomyces regalis]